MVCPVVIQYGEVKDYEVLTRQVVRCAWSAY